jgi:hypothetical protein
VRPWEFLMKSLFSLLGWALAALFFLFWHQGDAASEHRRYVVVLRQSGDWENEARYWHSMAHPKERIPE